MKPFHLTYYKWQPMTMPVPRTLYYELIEVVNAKGRVRRGWYTGSRWDGLNKMGDPVMWRVWRE